MLGKIFSDLSKTLVRISAVIVLAFLFASCSETVLNPEDIKDDSPVLGWPEPQILFYSMGTGDLQFKIKCSIYSQFNSVTLEFTNSEDPSGYSLTLLPAAPVFSFTDNLGHVKINARVQLIPPSLNKPGSIYLSCFYSRLDGSDGHSFEGLIFTWN